MSGYNDTVNYSDNDTDNYSNNSLNDDGELIPDAVRFWVYLTFLIPSIICSLFVLYYLLWHRTLRQALHNHAIIIFLFIGLIYEVTIYPWMLYLYQHDGVWERSPFFCTLWVFIDWGLYFTQTILFAWATVERHILIFHYKWVSTKKKRLIVHYLPLVMLVLYCLSFYIVITFFPTCENIFDDYYIVCIQLCSFKSSKLYIYDTIVHQILPNLIVVVFSIALLLRVRHQKHRVGKSLQWRKHWKMTVQLLMVSILYLIFALPVTLVNFLHLCGLPYAATANFREYLLFFNYCMMLLCPFACALSLPQLREKITNGLQLGRLSRAVAPMTAMVRNTIHIETLA
jgi:hypothetical protein